MVEIRLDLVEGVRDRDKMLLNFLNLNYLFRFTKSGLYCSCKLTRFSVTLGYQDE